MHTFNIPPQTPRLYGGASPIIGKATVHAKLYDPYSIRTWYIVEFDGANVVLCYTIHQDGTRGLQYESLTRLAQQGVEQDRLWVTRPVLDCTDPKNYV